MAKVKTPIDPTKLLGAEKIEEYKPGIWYCYSPDKEGKHELLAVVHESKGEYIVDAEPLIVALIPTAVSTTETPNPLYDIYVKAYGKTALHIGPQVTGDFLAGHRILSQTLSSTNWETIRKKEYLIAEPEPESEDLLSSKDENRYV